eukprot:1732774-Rhodomonas_salina.2
MGRVFVGGGPAGVGRGIALRVGGAWQAVGDSGVSGIVKQVTVAEEVVPFLCSYLFAVYVPTPWLVLKSAMLVPGARYQAGRRGLRGDGSHVP